MFIIEKSNLWNDLLPVLGKYIKSHLWNNGDLHAVITFKLITEQSLPSTAWPGPDFREVAKSSSLNATHLHAAANLSQGLLQSFACQWHGEIHPIMGICSSMAGESD